MCQVLHWRKHHPLSQKSPTKEIKKWKIRKVFSVSCGDHFHEPVPPLGERWVRDRSAGTKHAKLCFQSCRTYLESKCCESASGLSCLCLMFKWIRPVVYPCSNNAVQVEYMDGAEAFLQAVDRKYVYMPVYAHSGRETVRGTTKIPIVKKCGLTRWLISLIVQRLALCWIFFLKLGFKYVLTGWIFTARVTAGRNDSSAFVIKLLSGK